MNRRLTLVCATAALMACSLLAQTATRGGGTDGSSTPTSGDGYGTVRPFALSLEALKGPEVTDVYVAVKVQEGYDVPATAGKIQIKSLDEAGEVRWTRNDQRVALDHGLAQYQYSDLARHMPMQAQVNVSTSQTVNEEVLRASTIVLLRPDLTIEAVNAPKQARVGEKVIVEVVVRELNQDLGASFHGYIAEGGADVDTVEDAMVDAGGTASLVYVMSFDEPGIHMLVAGVRNASPGEYSESNNTMEFQIEVKNPVEPIQYGLGYWDQTWDNSSDYSAYWGYSHSDSRGRSESTYYGASMSQTLSWPVESLKVEMSADGNLKFAVQLSNIDPTYSYHYNDPYYGYDYSYQYYQTYLPDENAWVWINSYDYRSPWGDWTGSSHGVSRWAADYVYHSHGYNDYYGRYSWDYSGVVHEGAFWGARECVESNVVLTDDLTHWGGRGKTSYLYHYQQPRQYYSGSDWWGSWSGWYEYDYWYGYGYGMTE